MSLGFLSVREARTERQRSLKNGSTLGNIWCFNSPLMDFQKLTFLKSDVWFTVHHNSVWIRKTN